MFGVAGLAKLADRAGSRRALVDFGVPSALANPLGIILPVAELAVAVALLPVVTAWFGAVGALFLLLLFVIAIAINLARGRTPECHCFGQLSSAPAGWATLSRNAGLTLLSGFVVWQGRDNTGTSAVDWVDSLSTAQRVFSIIGFAGLVVVAFEGWILLQMLRQQGRLLLRLEVLERKIESAGISSAAVADARDEPVAGLPVGTVAPTFRIKRLRGEPQTLEALLSAGKPLLLFFTHPNCGPCRSLMPDISRYQRQHDSALTIALISEGTFKDNRAMRDEFGVTQIFYQKEGEVADAYEAHGTPSGVLIRSDGTIGSPLAMGADAVRGLIAQALRTPVFEEVAAPPSPQQNGGQRGSVIHDTSSPPTIGQPAPPLKLRDLEGKTIDLNTFRGSETLLLFWNPDCGFCQRMLDDLRSMEMRPSAGAPKLLVVSTGTIEDNLAMGLLSKVLVDPDFQTGPIFGADGTPMAVLVDANGRIASDVAVGAQAVFALAGVRSEVATNPS